MTTTKKLLVYSLLLAAVTVASQPAWAVTSPEPQSGGRFFPGKGTKAAESYSGIYAEDGSYSRTERGAFDRQHYAKGLKLGILEVKPSAGYTGEYDSNVFLTEDDAKGDYISRLNWGVDADLPMEGGKYLLTSGIHSESEWFAKYNGENHTDWDYRLGGEANFSAFNIAVHDNFRDTSDRSDSDLTDRVKRYENRLDGLLTIPFGQFFSETEVTDFIVNFRNNDAFEGLDRHEISVFPRLGVDVGKRTQALLEYGYTHIGYDDGDRDGNAHQVQAGVRGNLGNADLISYQAWGGWQFRNYSNGNLDDFNNFIGHGELVYKPSEISKFILKAIRRPEESVAAGQTFYTRNELSLKYRRQIAEQWYANAQGGIGFNHYNNDRLDFLWEPGVGLEYVLPGKILALFTEYKFSARHSDTDGRDYNRHIANFGIKAEV